MTGVNLQQTFKYKYTLKQICHCEEQRDDAIWTVLTRLLHFVRNDSYKVGLQWESRVHNNKASGERKNEWIPDQVRYDKR